MARNTRIRHLFAVAVLAAAIIALFPAAAMADSHDDFTIVVGNERVLEISGDDVRMPGIHVSDDEVNLPGIRISGDTVSVPGVRIDDSGVNLPGIRIDDSGVNLPGVSIGDHGVSLPGLHIGDHGVRFGGWDSGNRWFPWVGSAAFLPFAAFNLVSWIGLFALAALTLALAPAPVARMAGVLNADPLRAALIGLAVMVLAPLALAVLAITIIGIPVAALAALALVAAKFLGYVALAVWLGHLAAGPVAGLRGDAGQAYLRLLVGSLALAVVGAIPLVNLLVGLAGAMLGLGAVLVTRFGTRGPLLPAPAGPAAA